MPRHSLSRQLSGRLGVRTGLPPSSSLQVFIQPVRAGRTDDDSFAFQRGNCGLFLKARRFLSPGRDCQPYSPPLEIGQLVLDPPGLIQRVAALSVPQSAVHHTHLPSLGTPDSYSLLRRATSGLPCRCPLGTAQSKALSPLDGR